MRHSHVAYPQPLPDSIDRADLGRTVIEQLFNELFTNARDGKAPDPLGYMRKLIGVDVRFAMAFLEATASVAPIFADMQRAIWSAVPGKMYAAPPPVGRLDILSGIFVLGLDIKITPTHQPVLIEINGLKSGAKGFAQTRQRTKQIHDTSTDRADHVVDKTFARLGDIHLGYLGTRLCAEGCGTWRMPIVDDLLRHFIARRLHVPELSRATIHPSWDAQYGALARRVAGAEHIFADKFATDQLVRELPTNKPSSHLADAKGMKSLLRSHPESFIVIKPREGSLGKGVSIGTLREVASKLPGKYAAKDWVLEPFVPSKPIFSRESRRFHDGCMRYLVVVEELRTGQLETQHAGGYWRLSPRPIDEYGHTDAMRANLSNGALAEPAGAKELATVREFVDGFLPGLIAKLPQ